ncbi:MAG: DUF4349 domain-containing protein [Fimbriimonadaceae bacterium]|nr:DUF4349 domain-containing protein [Fimbriimonadaceae bacterium]
MRTWLLWSWLGALALTGCGPQFKAARTESAPPPAAMPASPVMAADEAMAGAPGGPVEMATATRAGGGAEAPSKPGGVAGNRKIVYTANLTVEVKALEAAVGEVKKLVGQHGGYISGLQQSGGRLSRNASITVRVPAERFDAMLAELAKLGTVVDRQLTTEDVTSQWVDLDARLRNSQRAEQRFLAILQNAGSVSDLLTVERELARVRGEIEQLEGQMRQLRDLVSLCTVTVNLSLPPEIDATANERSWLAEVCSDAAASFVHVGMALVALAIKLAAMAPYLALLWLVGRGLKRLWRRRRERPVA